MSASSEPRTRKVVLPDVVGLHLRDATTVLRNAGLSRWRVHYTEAYADEFSIVEQSPRSGQLIDSDREIGLQVTRQNLVSYLPQVFQQESTDAAAFLRGFLYIVQHGFDSVSSRLEQIHELFDPRTSDPEFLPWLASWLAITLSPDWDDLQRRRMLLAATRLFPYRGTKRAIEEFVHIYTGANVTIEENTWPFSGFRIGAGSTVGDDAVILPPMNLAHCFVVRLDRPASEVPEDEIIKIHQIIQAQKPAHTSYYLAFRDEEEAGEMGVFMTVGGGIGVGMDVGAPGSGPEAETSEAGEAPEAEAEGAAKESSPKKKKTASKRSTSAKKGASKKAKAEDTSEAEDTSAKKSGSSRRKKRSSSKSSKPSSKKEGGSKGRSRKKKTKKDE
ncbi:MAG: phage tail protein [Myxococcota bacterium]